MRNYQLIFFLPPDIIEREQSAKKIISEIENLGGKIKKVEDLERKILSYPIKKYKEGLMGIVDFELSPENLNNLQTKLNLQSWLLRNVVVGLPEVEISPIRGLGTGTKKERLKGEETPKPAEKKVELKEIDKKLKEILGE